MQITKGTIIRTIVLALVLINLILKAFGKSIIPYDESFIAQIVETVVELGAIICAWWYNNSFTENARKADAFFKQLKSGEDEITEPEDESGDIE